jgi:hypothetical protein
MSDKPLLHIIYLESQMLLSKKRYLDWRQVQDEFTDYKASLGPWSVTEILDFLYMEYPTHCPFPQEQIQAFLDSDAEIITT